MKYLKRFNESVLSKEEIEKILIENFYIETFQGDVEKKLLQHESNSPYSWSALKPENYIINDDGTVDIVNKSTSSRQSVFSTEDWSGSRSFLKACSEKKKNIGRYELKGEIKGKLPIKFRKVEIGFDCSNCDLTTLENCPDEVYGSFICENNFIKDLTGGPQRVDKAYILSGNRNLTSLVGSPQNMMTGSKTFIDRPGQVKYTTNVMQILNCPITNLTGSPREMFSLRIEGCPELVSLEGGPDSMRELYILNCPNLKAIGDWMFEATEMGKILDDLRIDIFEHGGVSDFDKSGSNNGKSPLGQLYTYITKNLRATTHPSKDFLELIHEFKCISKSGKIYGKRLESLCNLIGVEMPIIGGYEYI